MLQWSPYWVVGGVVLEEWARSPISDAEYIVDRAQCAVWERWCGSLSYVRAAQGRSWAHCRQIAEGLARGRYRRAA